MGKKNENLKFESFLSSENALYLEQLQKTLASDKIESEHSWSEFFKKINSSEVGAPTLRKSPSWQRTDWPPAPTEELTPAMDGQWAGSVSEEIKNKILEKASSVDPSISKKVLRQAVLDSIRALMIIRAYRIRGHLAASLDPLGLTEKNNQPELNPESYGFNETDLDRPIFIDNVLGLETASMREIVKILRRTYCGNFALQYMHISNPKQSSWLKERIEGLGKEIQFTKEGRRAILNKLVEAEGFEKFLHVKYMGTKRFGLDGAEALIPAMEQIIKRGGSLGIEEIIIGMPHRGRLSVLANVMSKPFRAIFNEFQGGSYKPEDVDGSGDVKYHLGTSSDREFDNNSVHLSLTANPSHLEAVNPVVLGKVRAKQQQKNDVERTKVLPVLLHGDAAFAGQGVVAECFGLSGLKGHKTGGTIHIIVNNQIGFTTSPLNSRSSPYPTDIALMVEAPIFHVNGDDPEAVVHAAKVATEFRQKFNKDVVIDIFCYRRFGHNEGDEPMFTQPKMYSKIKEQKTTLQIYSEKLMSDGLIDAQEFDQIKKSFQIYLTDEFSAGATYKPNKADWLDGRWAGFKNNNGNYERGETAIENFTFGKVASALTKVPKPFNLHRTVKRMLLAKAEMLKAGENIDWATGEALAFGSLLLEGYPVRLSGQDCTRGTFSQRHSAFIDQTTEEKFYPLNNIEQGQSEYEVIDSMLSEYAVLGYEYGYTLAEPNALTLWEAQFGDFANGAQIMIDQFISSGEKKWLRMSGLVMLLPHGYEGQGPEHSSARLERFLQACAEDNWIVANCTTPANYFHLLRRQIHRKYRKPLVIMTPKSLLRNKLAVSNKKDFLKGSSFHRVLWDDSELRGSSNHLRPDREIRKVIICSGKVYFDLLNERDIQKINDIYILRVEQFYPFPTKSLTKELSRFKNAVVCWCQEEPKNQGAWNFMEPNIEWILGKINAKARRPVYAGRSASASPATGLAPQHKSQQELLIDEALNLSGEAND